MATYRYLVRGRVQGVGYRYFAMKVALSLNLAGFARNLGDGRVEVVAEGSAEALSELEARLLEGPAFADVSEVTKDALAPRGDEGFHIR